jgi:hypothetical protein
MRIQLFCVSASKRSAKEKKTGVVDKNICDVVAFCFMWSIITVMVGELSVAQRVE